MASVPKAEQSQRTKRTLLDTARKLFTEKGYANTSTEEIVRQAGVTRGALYYHYQGKSDIFAAVFNEVRIESALFISEKMRAAESAGADLWQWAVVSCHAFVESALTPTMQHIVHTDGPSVLGWPTVQKSGPGLTLIREGLRRMMDKNIIERMPLDPLSHVIWGTFFEAGTYIASADNIATAREEMTTVLIRLLAGLQRSATLD